MAEDSSFSKSSVFQKTLLASLLAIFVVGFSSMGAADTGIDTCQELDSSGVYNLTSQIDHSNTNTCLNVTSSDVTIDGQDYAIDGQDSGGEDGLINVYNSTEKIYNVTVNNITLNATDDSVNGRGLEASDVGDLVINNSNISEHKDSINFFSGTQSISVNNSIVENTFINASTEGVIDSSKAQNNTFENITIEAGGFSMGLDSQNTTIRNSELNGSLGFTGTKTSDIVLENSTVSVPDSNSAILSTAFYDPMFQKLDVAVIEGRNVTINETEISFISYGTTIGVDTPKSVSSDLRRTDKFLELRAENETASYVELNVSYTSSQATEFDEDGLTLYNKTGSTYSELDSNFKGVDKSSREVYGNFTSEDLSTSLSSVAVLDEKYKVEGCQVIDYSGVLDLTSDIIDSAVTSNCVSIESSDVSLNGNDLKIDGDSTKSSSEHGIMAGSISTRNNITVENLTIKDWKDGLEFSDVENSSIENITAENNEEHVKIMDSTKNVTLENSTLNSLDGSLYGVELRGTNNSLLNNTFSANYNTIALRGVEDADIKENKITSGTGSGDIYVVDSSNKDVLIKDNNISSKNRPITITSGVDNVTVKSNYILGKYFGIEITDDVSNISVESNDIDMSDSNSGNAIKMMETGGGTPRTIELFNNNISGAADNGTYIDGVNGSDIFGNIIENNDKRGISVIDTIGLNMTENTIFENSKEGLHVENSSDAHIIDNNITSNNFNNDNVDPATAIISSDNLTFRDNLIEGSNYSASYFEVNNSELIDNEFIDNNGTGVEIGLAHNNTFTGNKITQNSVGFLIGTGSLADNNSISDGSQESNDVGVRISEDSGQNTNNTFENVSLKNSGVFVDYESDELSNDFKDVDLFTGINTTFDGKNIKINKTASRVSSLPGQNFSIGSYFNVTNVSQGSETAWVDFNVTYDDSVVKGINESTLSIQHYNGSQWTGITDAGVDTADNRVYGNATSFSQFTISGEGQPAINVDPSSHDFGETDTGNDPEKVFNITNIGNLDLNITDISITGNEPAQFEITGNKNGTVGSGGKNVSTSDYYEVEVEFNPDSTGEKDANLEIISNDPNSPETVDLEGDGTSSNNNNNEDDSDDSSGGGGGGGGASTGAASTTSKLVFSLGAGESTQFDVEDSENFGVTKVNLTVSETVEDSFDIEVAKQEGQPEGVSEASENVYRYLNVDTPGLDQDNIESSTIGFEVNKSWVNDNSIDVDSVELRRYNEGSWNSLATSKVGESDSKLEFEAATPGYSYFAVTGESTADDGSDSGQTGDNTGSDTGGDDTTAGEEDSTGEESAGDVNQSDTSEKAGTTGDGAGIPWLVIVFVLLFVAAIFGAYLKREEIESFMTQQDEDKKDDYSF